MKPLETLLEKFDEVLKLYNPTNYKKLQPPLSEDKIVYYLTELGISDKNLWSLFKWKNGFNCQRGENRHNQIFNFGGLLSLNYIFESEKLDMGTWEKGFIPLISSGDGDYIIFNNEKGKNYGKLHLYSVSLLSIDDPVICYDSLHALIETTTEAYEKRALTYDPTHDWLDRDGRAFREIALKYNRSSDFWKLD